MWRRLGIGFLAFMATFLVVMAAVQVLITCYRLDIIFPLNKDICIMLAAGVWVWFYHHMMRLSS